MLAASVDRGDVLALFLGEVLVPRHELGETQNGIERGPKLVTHVCQERALGYVCRLRRLFLGFQCCCFSQADQHSGEILGYFPYLVISSHRGQLCQIATCSLSDVYLELFQGEDDVLDRPLRYQIGVDERYQNADPNSDEHEACVNGIEENHLAEYQ